MSLSSPAIDATSAEGAAPQLELALAPLGSDPQELGVEDGMRIWDARSCDPAFLARTVDGAPLERGWYRASAVLDGRSGDIDAPRIYIPDRQNAFSEGRSVKMMREGPVYAAELFLPRAVPHLRLDPSRRPCELACNGLRLVRIPPRRAVRLAAARVLGIPARAVARIAAGAWRLVEPHVRRIDPPSRRSAAPGRRQRVLATIERDGTGIEIGPSHDPIAPKREGFKVHVIDHASREELIGKYKDHPVNRGNIEEVDFVWHGETYLELTGNPKHYDWIIASHVVEHTPDLIAFLNDCDSILKDGGVLSLVVPDKRFCFDRWRPITGLARIIDGHFAGHRIHSAGAAAEYFMNVARKDGELSWDESTRGDYIFAHSAQYARDMIREVREKGSYLDVHNWCFTPHSFRLLVNDLHALGFIRLREVSFNPTEGSEFYVTLGRHGTGPDKSRLELLRAIDAELAAAEPPSRLRAAWRAIARR